jgi:hypothetical protein
VINQKFINIFGNLPKLVSLGCIWLKKLETIKVVIWFELCSNYLLSCNVFNNNSLFDMHGTMLVAIVWM